VPVLVTNSEWFRACLSQKRYKTSPTCSHKHGIVECLEEYETYCCNFSIATTTGFMINSIKRSKYRTIKVHS
jgi:hypothetical protein